MKRLLFRLLLLGAPFATFLLYCEYRVAQHPPDRILAKKELFQGRRAEIETLVMGSSHTWLITAPDDLGPHTFNAAVPEQTLYHDCEIVRRHLDEMPALRRVIIPISYFSLESMPPGYLSCHYCYAWRIPHDSWRANINARNYFAYFLFRSELSHEFLFGPIADARLEFDSWGGPCRSRRNRRAQPKSIQRISA